MISNTKYEILTLFSPTFYHLYPPPEPLILTPANVAAFRRESFVHSIITFARQNKGGQDISNSMTAGMSLI